ncbi:MAG: AAA family ATPase [Eubacteriales bacterium]|nr:AAA family ATPase [Eubacteriales bacterium]
MSKAVVEAIVNQKGGVGKTTTCENLGIGLAKKGKKVLLVDLDPQASLTVALGKPFPDAMETTVADLMKKVMDDEAILCGEGILKHEEGVDFLPANISLSGLEVSLVNAMSRESVLKQYVDEVKGSYDYILIDCMPSLGMLTVNALAAADKVLIPMQADYLSAKGLEQLLHTINKVRRQINPKLEIDGILLTMADMRTNNAQNMSLLVHEVYGNRIKIFKNEIPRSVRAAETTGLGVSIYEHDPEGKVAAAYRELTKEVLAVEKKRKHQLEELR